MTTSNTESNSGDDQGNVTMFGHLLIRDTDTDEVLVNQRDGLVHQKDLGNENER